MELFIFPIIEVMKLVSILNKVFDIYLPLIFATWILKHLDSIQPLKNLLTTQVKLEQTPLEVIKMVIMVNNYGYQKSKN
jgi:hypothetical protein